jgi:hypothetical protein
MKRKRFDDGSNTWNMFGNNGRNDSEDGMKGFEIFNKSQQFLSIMASGHCEVASTAHCQLLVVMNFQTTTERKEC